MCHSNRNIAPLQVQVTYIAATVNTAKRHYIIFSVIPSVVKRFNIQSRFCPQITPKITLIFLTGPGLSHSPQEGQQLNLNCFKESRVPDFCEWINQTSDSTKGRRFLDQLFPHGSSIPSLWLVHLCLYILSEQAHHHSLYNCIPQCSRHSPWTAWPLKMGPIGYPETSVYNYQYTLR
jgi:hypothetical protein